MITIKQRVVTDAVVARLSESNETVTDLFAPENPPQRYVVVEPLQAYTDGGPLLTDHSMWIEYRIRCVAVDPGVAGRVGPRMDAEALIDITRSILSDRTVAIGGVNWRITDRRLEASSFDSEGRSVNAIDDWSFLCCPF